MVKHKWWAILLSVLAMASAQAFPIVSNDPGNIVLGQWTRQAAAARAKAAALGRPMLVFFGDTVTCGKCKAWDAKTLGSPLWDDYAATSGMVMIWVDRAYSASEWAAQKAAFGIATQGFGFPKILVLSPTGALLDTFEAIGGYQVAAGFIARIKPKIDLYPYNVDPGTIGFTVASAAVNEADGSLLVTVARTGGSADAQAFSYATANGTAIAGTHYSAASGTLNWGSGDAASKTFSVPLINDGVWNLPVTRTFTISLAKVTGTATLGTALLTVTITEATANAPGSIGFTSATGNVREGHVYTGYVSRVGGSLGAANATITASGGYLAIPTPPPPTLSWANGNSDLLQYTITNIAATLEYDRRNITVTLAVSGAGAGITTQKVDVLDQEVTKTLGEYKVGKPAYAPLAVESGFWFYNDTVDALRTEPLQSGESSVLSWTAPAGGRLIFMWGGNDIPTNALRLALNGVTNALAGPIATNSVGLKAGEVVRWIATSGGSNFVARFAIVQWQPLTAATLTAPANNALLQKGAIAADKSIVDLKWTAAVNPGGTIEHVYAGATVALASDRGAGVSGVNAVDMGIVNTNIVQGDVFWQVVSMLGGDFGTTGTVASTFFKFTVVDLPVFQAEAPAPNSTVSVFLTVDTAIDIPVVSATPVTYQVVGLLPLGMSINAATGKITGIPRSRGAHPITVNVTNSGGTSSVTFTLDVQALPAYAKGKFQGALIRTADDVLFGSVALSATASGRLSAKVATLEGDVSMRGSWGTVTGDGILSGQLSGRNGQVLDVEVSPSGLLTLAFEGKNGFGHALANAPIAPFAGYYTALITPEVVATNSAAINNAPAGLGFVAITVGQNGLVRYKGIMPDGAAVSGSASLAVFNAAELNSLAMGFNEANGDAWHAAFPVLKKLYNRRGVASSLWWIDGRVTYGAGNNLLWVDKSVWLYSGKSAALTGDGFLAVLNTGVSGFMSPSAQYAGALYVKPANFSVYAGGAFAVDYGTAPVNAAAASITLNAGNALNAVLSVNQNTGFISGRVLPPGQRTATLKGIVVPETADGGGHYLVPDPSTGAYRLKRSHYFTVTGP